MADIRIKDLAVTASSSASDDYLAVDGSTNGTRKLSAYSPTFGGNLTVSGTGTFGGTNLISIPSGGSGTYGYGISNVLSGGGLKSEFSYVTSTGVTQLRALAEPGSGNVFALRTKVSGNEQDSLSVNFSGNTTLAGNLTVSGGTISSGVGNDLTLQQVNYGGGLTALASGQVKIAAFNGQSIRLQTQGADALTLDSSQNATFAGQVMSAYTGDWVFKALPTSGADRNLALFGVSGATNGLTVKWNHSTSTLRINLSNLPTSSSGLAAGDLYNSGGTIKIV